MSKISFFRTILISLIIIVAGYDFSLFYITKQIEDNPQVLIHNIIKENEHKNLTSELQKIKEVIVSDFKLITNSTGTINNSTIKSLQENKQKSLMIKLKIIKLYGILSNEDNSELKRINFFYDKAIILINTKKNVRKVIANIQVKKGIVGITNIPTFKQGYNQNTCVIDNLSLVSQSIYGKGLNKAYIYNSIGKKVGQLWQTGLYYRGINGEGNFIPMNKDKYLYNKKDDIYVKKDLIKGIISTGGGYKDKNGNIYEIPTELANDFEKIKELGIFSTDGNTFGKLELYIEAKVPVVMEIPMAILYPNKLNNYNLWHAISVFGIDYTNNEIIYSNTLTGKVERLSFKSIQSDINGQYLKYPFHIIQMNTNNDKIFIK